MTPEEGLRKQIELYRSMTPQRRLQISFELDDLARQLARAGVRHQHADWNDEQVEREGAWRFRLAKELLRTYCKMRAEKNSRPPTQLTEHE